MCQNVSWKGEMILEGQRWPQATLSANSLLGCASSSIASRLSDSSLLVDTGEIHPEYRVQCWASLGFLSLKRDMGIQKGAQWRGTRVIKTPELLFCEERLREQVLFILEQEGDGHTEKSPVQGPWGDKKIRTALLWAKTERTDTIHAEE